MTRVSVVVVTYNSERHIECCLRALRSMAQEPSFEVIVSDNRSQDRTKEIVERLARESPGRIRWQGNATNRGYAGGVNAALPVAVGEFVGVLNPDIIVEAGWLKPLVAFLDAEPGAGAVNPLILLEGEEQKVNAAGQQVHVTGLGFNRWLGRPRSQAEARGPVRVSGIQGGAFVVRRSLLEEMGGWDESGFLYHEDVELSWLLQIMGCDLYCVPQAVVCHDYRLTMYPGKLYLLERNRWSLLSTHMNWGARIVLSPLLLFTELLMWSYCTLRGPRFLAAKAKSIRWALGRRHWKAERRARVRALRRRTDFALLARLDWGYAWGQFFTLGRQRGPFTRRPAGGVSIEDRDAG